MTTSSKARVAAGICAIFFVWPAIHRGVVATFGTNAWQLGGFAMYATPPARTRVLIVEINGREETILAQSSLPAAFVAQQRLFQIRRGVLGLLLLPDALAESYFKARPRVDHLRVVIQREMLSAGTARIERRESIHLYDR